MPSRTIQRARELRAAQTDAERQLWRAFRNRQFFEYRFNRQYPIGRYIVDFCCRSERVVVELDGGQHDIQRQYDEERTAYLIKHGYVVIRFWNSDVTGNFTGVLEELSAQFEMLLKDPGRPSL